MWYGRTLTQSARITRVVLNNFQQRLPSSIPFQLHSCLMSSNGSSQPASAEYKNLQFRSACRNPTHAAMSQSDTWSNPDTAGTVRFTNVQKSSYFSPPPTGTKHIDRCDRKGFSAKKGRQKHPKLTKMSIRTSPFTAPPKTSSERSIWAISQSTRPADWWSRSSGTDRVARDRLLAPFLYQLFDYLRESLRVRFPNTVDRTSKARWLYQFHDIIKPRFYLQYHCRLDKFRSNRLSLDIWYLPTSSKPASIGSGLKHGCPATENWLTCNFPGRRLWDGLPQSGRCSPPKRCCWSAWWSAWQCGSRGRPAMHKVCRHTLKRQTRVRFPAGSNQILKNWY